MWLGELDLPEVLDFLAEFLVSSDVETPWLDSLLVPDSHTRAGETPSYHNQQ